MPDIKSKFEPRIKQLNINMIEHTRSNKDIINIALEDLIMGGGKRIRPILTILTGKFGDYHEKKIINLASALELLHMATLVHDDIIDDAEVRRGETTAQKKFGQNIAVFIGDYLLSKSLKLFSENSSQESLQRLNKVVKLICEGEISQYQEKYNYNISITDYLKRIRRKTALLFGFSTYIGAYESNLRGQLLHQLYNLGLELGMVFQIQDDILDFTGQQDKTGKAVGQDLSAGIYTLPVIYLLNDKDSGDKVKNILEQKELTPTNINKITKLINSSSALKKSRNLARKYLNKASHHIKLLPDNKYKGDLKYILNYQLKRQK